MWKILLLLCVSAVCSCGKAGMQKAEAESQNKQIAYAPPEKSVVMKRIDEQAALINLLVTTPNEWCRSMTKLEQLPSLASSGADREYAESKAKEVKSALVSRQREILNKYWSANFDQKKADAAPQNNIVSRFRAEDKVAEVVSANILSTKSYFDFEDTQKNTVITYLLTVRQHTGLFSKDLFFNVNAKSISQYNLVCDNKGGIIYSSDIVSVNQVQH